MNGVAARGVRSHAKGPQTHRSSVGESNRYWFNGDWLDRMRLMSRRVFGVLFRGPAAAEEARRPCATRVHQPATSHARRSVRVGVRAQGATRQRSDGQLILNDATKIVRAAVDGFGLTCLPEGMVWAHVGAGRLIRVLEDWCPPFPGYHLYYPTRRQNSPAFAVILEALRERA